MRNFGFILLLAVLLPGKAFANSIVNLLVDEKGMQRITYADFMAENVDLAGLQHKYFSVTLAGKRVAIRTEGENGKKKQFGPGGFIEFYADVPDSLYTTQQAYTLNYAKGDRLQIGEDKAKKFKANKGFSSAYQYSEVLEQDNYYDYLSPSETDPWHYGRMFGFAAGDTAGTSVDLDLAELAGNSVDLDIHVFGVVDIKSEGNDHHVVAKVNGVEVGDQQFDGNINSTLSIVDAPVTAGINNLQLYLRSIASTPFDSVALNEVRVSYQRNAVTKAGYLEGYVDAAQISVSLDDPLAEEVEVYVKQGEAMTRLTGLKIEQNSVGINTNGVSAEYIVVADNNHKKPALGAIQDQQDISSGQAEYLIISHAGFIGNELDQLVQLREVDYSVKVVDVAQIYGQYGNHLPSADAIHAYVKHAVANMGTRFVTLVGSDTYDYKNHGGSQSVSYVPTKYAQTPGGLLFIRQTPSDASYGDTDDDGIPDVPVGRLSVRTTAELGMVVEKIRDYQAREGYAGRILIAADKEDAGNGISFTDDVTALIAAIPADWRGAIRSDFRAIPDIDGDAVAHQKVIAAINAGVSVAAYIGHSSQQQWSRATPALFKANEIAGLTNIDKPTVVTQWGCWNTYYVDPAGNSMSDLLLVGGENGAATVLGASTLTTAAGERVLGIELNQRMYNKGVTIGEAVIDAKRALALNNPNSSDILLGWQIIGDPALVVNP